MCRSIVQLRKPEGATEDELTAAARQFVRKISGFRTPSKVNEAVFERAVIEIAASSHRLLQNLVVRPSVRVEGGDRPEVESSADGSTRDRG
jgi:hypothetical protein